MCPDWPAFRAFMPVVWQVRSIHPSAGVVLAIAKGSKKSNIFERNVLDVTNGIVKVRVVESETDEFIPTRQTLLSRLKDWNDQDSWKDFFDTYWKLIYRTALKYGLTDAEAQDVVQETIISVAKAMPNFTYDDTSGSFKKWLLQLTGWRITDQLRKRQPRDESEKPRFDETTGTTALERISDPGALNLEALWDTEWETNMLEAALERVKRRVDPKQYQIFDFYVVQRWPVSKVASTLRVRAGSVYLAKHRISGLIKREIKRLRTHVR